jgi:hypothetical protein
MSEPLHTLDLPALDGANPLGFLAALGTLSVLSETDPTLKLGWHARARWVPFLASTRPFEESDVLQRLATPLRGQAVDPMAERKRELSQRRLNGAKRQMEEAKKALKSLNLRGNHLKTERERMVEPLRIRFEKRRQIVRGRRNVSVPSPELAIGKKVDLSADEFRSTADSFFQGGESGTSAIAMLAALATESCNSERCPRTRFDFIDSSGQLAFLEAVLHLMGHSTPERLKAALFESWKRADEKYSLRFDPVEDRRYALLDRDPTAGNNKSTSEWMANLLAYRALSLFPCVISQRGTATTGWAEFDETWCFTWPIWESSLSVETIRSLLTHQELAASKPADSVRRIGVAAAYRTRKVANGDYVNFSPAFAVL